MTCAEANVLIEDIASGETVTGATRAHVDTCPLCAARLRLAQRVDRWLNTAAASAPPQHFTAAVMSRIRQEQWRAEQTLDWAFNVAVGLGIVLVIVGLGGLVSITGVADISRDVFSVLDLVSGAAMRRAADQARTFGIAAAMLVLSLTVWWWVERDLTA